jgi:hypothetical protein
MSYLAYQRALRKASKLSTRQELLFRNHLSNFTADHPEDWVQYLPEVFGGNNQPLEDTHLKHIKKYALLLSLLS